MNLFENAEKFFHNCESAKGWEACKPYVADNAGFSAQSEPMAEITTVKEYAEMWQGLGGITLKGGSYEINASAYNEKSKTAIFFATYTGTHTGEGGPVPPTNKTTSTQYVYVVEMNDEGKVANVTKVWNASWALRELGWM